MRKLPGNPADNCPILATFTLLKEKTTWDLYRRSTGGAWVNVKLVARPSAPNKANYWLAFTKTRFNRCRDAAMFELHRPALYRAVLDHLGAFGWETPTTVPVVEVDDTADAIAKKAPPVETPVDASIEREPAVEVGLLRSLWVVTCVPDPLGWDEITITPTEGDGPSWVFFWNGSAFRDDESWLSFSTRYIKSAGPLEQMLRDLG